MPDATDNCPDVANSDQADGDADGVGNACDTLPPGNVPPKPGETSVVKVVSGEVFVKLPARTTLGFDGLRAPLQSSEFVPLKGAASIPLGATVDTTRGEVAIDSAANSFSAADRRAKRQSARIRAAIFLLKQKRAKAKSSSIPTDVSLAVPAGRRSPLRRRAAQGHGGPVDLDGRQGLLPHARRREHEHRPLRDLQHHRPLRRNAHPGGQGARDGGGQEEDGHGEGRPGLPGQGQVVQGAQGAAAPSNGS